MKTVTEALIKIRKIKGVTQKQLSKKSKIPLHIIQQIERWPKEPPTDRERRAICKALKITPNVIAFYRIEKKDVPAKNKKVYSAAFPALTKMINSLLK